MENTSAKSSFDAASALFGRLMADASGPEGTNCVPEPVQRLIARQVLEQTGWTVRELKDAAMTRVGPGPAIVPVTRHTDVPSLARRMADHSRRGGQVVMYPAGPFR